ncbi:oligo-1,6-glucosidase [Cryobacterium sp. MP_M5]|uniref:glycoside hydrolase family 13 protein n=1 Tax=unclassified Cryobacterium TaxID=2649013 RepID=UPI0018CAC50E|nr:MULTISPECIES: alpha-glucosidase [unclassified Cryobacterium]MBG6057403.1 oligo-1,6-glucosidase [Cryobacterium sp. MP_M3]MEC5175602.1 oligo-1,6-glucosidase [Cryobacterium sp. MP_M5]
MTSTTPATPIADAGAAAPWWTRAVVYQVYPRSFADSDGDGIGDLGGIRGRLDYLAELGVDALWLSPVYPSPQHDNGYDISDYQEIEPVFGDLAEFDLLVAEAHARGIKIVMDLVVNHTSDEHAWFRESRSSLTNPKRDWYWWRKPRGDGGPPNGWGSAFSGPAWTLDEQTGEYYLHLFAKQQPDLNWENPEVRQAVYSMMNWWLDRGVDGFRMDVINFIAKQVGLIDGPAPATGGGSPMGPQIHDYLHEMHEAVFAGRTGEHLTVGEMPGVDTGDAVLFTDPARGEVDMIFQFEHVGLDQGANKFDVLPRSLPALKKNLAHWQDGLAETGWNSLYLNNHDQPRLVSRFGNDTTWRYESATLWGLVLHLHRGTPYVYQGEEIGMTNVRFDSIDDYRDLESLNHYREAVDEFDLDPGSVLAGVQTMSRDNARTPMQWDATEQAGFTTGTPWLPVNPNHRQINVAADRAAEKSVFRFYQRLIALRHENPVVALGSFTLLEPEHERLYAFTRTLSEETLLVVANASDEPLDAPLPVDVSGAELILGNYPGDAVAAAALRPWEARLYRM